MSFRTRLTSFFILIVVIPMLAVGFLVFRLLNDSEQGKADARASGLASAATSLYESASVAATTDAQTIARNLSSAAGATARQSRAIRSRVMALASAAGLARVTVRVGSTEVADVGDGTAIAPGSAIVGARGMTVTASELTAAQYIRDLAAPGAVLVVREGSRTLASSLPSAGGIPDVAGGSTVSLDRSAYRGVTERFQGFGTSTVTVIVLSSLSATASATGSRVLAAAFIVGFLVLAFWFSVLASRGLQRQVSRFLQAARRLGGGDFSSPIQIEGRDEFAALAEEFNNMSSQLARRLEELSQERVRLREAVRRIGQTFASNLDRPALLELALKTAVDAVQASAGRVSARVTPDDPLAEEIREGSFSGIESAIYEAERSVLSTRSLGESVGEDCWVLSVPLVPLGPGGRTHGLITVARREGPFSDDDREVLRSLAAQATLALENVDLHLQVSRQAVTDELTGLANHGRFQELIGNELEQVRRYGHSLGLIMLDIDDFKSINDTYGHQQGDLVLKRVGRVVADNSREADYPARYGGEEMALILPHTDLEGTYAIAERIRTAIEGLRIPRRDDQGMLRITASLGVISSNYGRKDELIAAADAALYEAKRRGKNRTVRAPVGAANIVGAE
jgi:diguanylate cyclase (GGDEF)-like protein